MAGLGTERQGEDLSIHLPAEAGSVPKARHAVAVVAGDFGANPFDVAVATSEAVTNAVVHAYRDGAPGSVHVAVRTSDELRVEVVDHGVGMSPHLARKGLGLGFSIIGAMTKEFHVEDARPGVRICMYFERRP